MNLTSFDFITETVSENAVSMNSAGLFQINTMARFYNLMLLYFYFQIMVYIIAVIQHCFRKNNKFDRG